ncbi:amidohydrolase family protein [Dictyobacter aurantiacus]|uniref:2-pyrone-4,6-dicarboxylate hydrolase n=1 Tax=Dictyobacter aurantiacus TaxID=1936993 RepID=A0A401ZNL5_9CHLR|nr:amidohydrolase family protein [Dictyobacter aurantiacus]GCE08459.1 2-pyrone-4,6-dicarboxylate hydrolase [Dictyobacter aurantiacus]
MDELIVHKLAQFPIFDSHMHIVDPRFPLVANQGYLPDPFTVEDYRARTAPFHIIGGAVVSGSFQAEDQTYLLDALERLGPGFVGVTQLPVTVPDQEILRLHAAGVRAVRFNFRRGGTEVLEKLETLARRVYDLAGWHAELYIDSTYLTELAPLLTSLPRVCIDHLGLSQAGFTDLLRLVEQGAYVKATGFGRVDFDVPQALKAISTVNPGALVFATDLPCPRAPRPFQDSDVELVIEALGESLARRVFSENALGLYHPGI